VSGGGARVIGVLALQGGFDAHVKVLRALGEETREVRTVADLQALDGLVIPGGESTTMTLGIAREGLAEPLRDAIRGGLPVLGTCAGLIMLDKNHLDVMDMVARRNAFGRQVRSFEADLDFADLDGGPVHAVFIRAPWIAEHGPSVEILASVDGHPVAARQGDMMVLAFHPEITGETRLHERFAEHVRSRAGAAPTADSTASRA
jgi:5'-phosphate synthase pdxT subunit